MSAGKLSRDSALAFSDTEKKDAKRREFSDPITLTVIADDIKFKGDPFLISQALTNLVKNAIEHASKGSEVTIKAEKIEKRIKISVTNQGESIPDYAIDKLFDCFYSLPKANGSKRTGIGLSFVKEIAILYGG